MKDNQTRPVPMVPKLKTAIKKEKPTTKKMKEPKAPVVKAPKTKKVNSNTMEKKPKTNNCKEDTPKRKRGRPRNDEKLKNQEKLKEPKVKGTPGRKRKLPLNVVIKTEKEDVPTTPPKKPKMQEANHNMNGNSKMPVHRPCLNSNPMFLNHNVTNNNVNSNGLFHHYQKGMDFGLGKKPSTSCTTSKSVTFQPTNDLFNSNSLPKPFKNLPNNKSMKSILKNEVGSNNNSNGPQISPKDIKVEKGNSIVVPFRTPVKLHPQRMASLDALAKMHVICIPDRKPIEHHSKSTTSVVTTVCSEPFKSLTQCHERIQIDMKKESKDFKGSFVHKQINFVKEKQQVFVSHSVEQSKTISTKEKKKKKTNSDKKSAGKDHKPSKAASKNAKSLQTFPAKGEKKKPKVPKSKDADKKCAKTQGKQSKATKKSAKEKPLTKAISKKSKKVEQTKSEVKVKETIRMQKTCTYQSVTTVNSHGTTNSSVVPVSHVGLTTNYSKTKKTVVTDEECKNKINYSSGSVVNNSYCVTSDSPCSIGHHADCCKFHAHSSPQIIPFAHVQTCGLGHGLSRTSDSSSSSPSHYDGNFAVHRFGHQPTVIYSPPSPEYGCCCSSPIVQHDPCLLRKSIMTYPRHSHSGNFASQADALCTEYHSASGHQKMAPCCPCCDNPGVQYSPKNCEQSPLDLSLAASSSSHVEADHTLQPGHCPSPLCCSSRKLVYLRTSAGGFQHGGGYQPSSSNCYRFIGQVASCESQGSESLLQCSSSKSAADHLAVVAKSSLVPGGRNASQSNLLVPAKREKCLSPKQQHQPLLKKKQFAHGWSWKGTPREKMIALTNDSTPCPRLCYPSIEHKEGDVINEKDCVLLRSGPKDTDLPYVAKVSTFWENPEDGEMMMSLLWYYRPEHTDHGRKPGQMEDEVFASRHKDVNSIACIEDKCYVLTYSEYCRYRAKQTMEEDLTSMSSKLVPDVPEGYPRRSRLPNEVMATDIIFFCRHVYDFRQKRILKNPT